MIKWLKKLLGRGCPECGGPMHDVYGWDKRECKQCHYTESYGGGI